MGLFYLPLSYIAYDALDGDLTSAKSCIDELVEKGLVEYDFSAETVFVKGQTFFDKAYASNEVRVASILSCQPKTTLARSLVSDLSQQGLLDDNSANAVLALSGSDDSFTDNTVVHDEDEKKQEVGQESEDDGLEAVEPVSEEDAELAQSEDVKTATKTKRSRANKNDKSALEKEFDEQVWPLYPRRDGITAARNAYLKRVKNKDITLEQAIEACKNYNNYCATNHKEKEYIMMGSTFFGVYKRFEDYLSTNLQNTQAVSFTDEAKAKVNEYKQDFDAFMSAYPKKEGTVEAERHFASIVSSGKNTAEELIQAARNYAVNCETERIGYGFIKRADMFLDPQSSVYVDFINFGGASSLVGDAYSSSGEELPDFGADEAPDDSAEDTSSSIEPTEDFAENRASENEVLEDFGVSDNSNIAVPSWGVGFQTNTASTPKNALPNNPLDDEDFPECPF